MASIADLFIKLVADDRGLEAQVTGSAQRAGDRAGQTMGQRMGASTKRALGVGLAGVGAVLAVGLGLGTKGLIELDTVVADFTADTGAAADEAERAGDKILELSKRNLQPMSEIGATMAGLVTQMGLTQEGAEELTEPFLKFAEVTGQTGPDAVRDMDSVLDAYNLKAEDSQRIMDLLVASHQEFGTNVPKSTAVLARLAPQLTAANLEFEDGVGLLNLFEEAGVDASKAPQALTAALSKVESPEELQELIDDIAGTEDPFLRAQKAIDLFGSRAGPQLAQALAGTTGNLQDFTPSAEEAAGATEEAAAAFESSFGRRAELFIKNISGMATGLLKELGPGVGGVATAAATLGPVLGTRGLGGMFGKLIGGTGGKGGIMGLARTAIPSLIAGFGAMLPAAGGVIVALAPILIPIAAIAAAIAFLFFAWQNNWFGIRDIAKNVIDWLVANVWPVIKGIFAVVVQVVQTAVGIVVAIFKAWLAVWSAIIGAIVEVVKVGIGIVSAVIGAIVGVVRGVVSGVGDAIGVFRGIFEALGKVIGPLVDIILAPIKAIVGVVGWVADVVGGLFDFITGGADQAKADLHTVGGKATTTGGTTLPPPGRGGVPVFHSGAWEVPQDQLGLLQRGELVTPEPFASGYRDALAGIASQDGSRAGGGNTYIVNLQDKLPPVRSVRDIGSTLKRLGDLGYLTPRPRATTG